MTTSFCIAEASRLTGLTAHTLRYYEQMGLISPVARSGGMRRYNADDMRWLEFLVRLRTTGMRMRDMQRYAELRRQAEDPSSLAERQTMLEHHAERLEAKQRLLAETLQILRGKIRIYQDMRAATAH
jgi:DNA-binding transcriptional MerR regulator